jgi:hypothetical protein
MIAEKFSKKMIFRETLGGLGVFTRLNPGMVQPAPQSCIDPLLNSQDFSRIEYADGWPICHHRPTFEIVGSSFVREMSSMFRLSNRLGSFSL